MELDDSERGRVQSNMALQRVSLSSFLRTAKASFNNAVQNAKPVTLVIGNESAGKHFNHSFFPSVFPLLPENSISRDFQLTVP